MLRFVDQLKEEYAKADKALGGILPGGGTPGPLTPATRAVSEAVPIIDMVSPASANYYRDKVKADAQRGTRLASEAEQIVEEVTADPSFGDLDADPSLRSRVDHANQLRSEASLLGIISDPNTPPTSTRRKGQSHRDFYLQNQRYRNDFNPEEQENISQAIRRDFMYNQLKQRNKNLEELTTSEKKGVSWGEQIIKAEGMSTADGPDGGGLACVYGVNKVIKESGREVPWKDPDTGEESVYIPFVENWITSNGGEQVPQEEAKPGDIVTGGDHMGILTDQLDRAGNPVVLSNSSSKASMSFKYTLNPASKVYRVPQLQD